MDMKYVFVVAVLVASILCQADAQKDADRDTLDELMKQLNEIESAMKYMYTKLPVDYITSCPHSFVRLKDSCYKFVSTNVSWFEASYLCKVWGTRLVSIDTEDENSMLGEHLNDIQDDNRYWAGGHDFINEGFHVWDSSKQPFQYEEWEFPPAPVDSNRASSEAAASNTVEKNCVIMRTNLQKLQWKNEECQNLCFFVCEAPKLL